MYMRRSDKEELGVLLEVVELFPDFEPRMRGSASIDNEKRPSSNRGKQQ